MKKLTFLLLLFPAILFSQLQISNINSKNVFDVMVFKSGTKEILSTAIVLPGETLDFETYGETVDIWYKPLTKICDYTDSKEFLSIVKNVTYDEPEVKKDGSWRHINSIVTPSKWFGVYLWKRTGVLPRLDCEKA